MRVSGAAAYGIYSRNVALPDVVHTLNRAGFRNEDICMVFSPAHPVASDVRDTRVVDATRESRALGTMGWISEFGAVVIPTVGFFIRSQRFFRSLMTDKHSGFCGGSATLAGLGFPENEVPRLRRTITDSGALIYVSCPEGSGAARARELLSRTGACEAASLESEQAVAAVA